MTAEPNPQEQTTRQEREIWAKFDAEIQKGFDDIEAGRLKDADDVFDRLEAKYASMSSRHG